MLILPPRDRTLRTYSIRTGNGHWQIENTSYFRMANSEDVKQVRAFLDLTRYYTRFIKNYATIATPLIDLLKKDGFQWSARALE